MANYAHIKNTKKLKPEQILKVLKTELETRFKFKVQESYEKENKALIFKIHDWNFIIWHEGRTELTMLDCPDNALRRQNADHPNAMTAMKDSSYFCGVSCGFCFIYEYIKHFLAAHLKSKIDSSVGKLTPFKEAPEKFNSFKDWMDYCKKYRRQDKLFNLFSPSYKKVYQTETTFFPELK